MNGLFRRSAASSEPRLRKWGRRFLYGTAVMATGYVCADYWTANSITRSLRTIKAATQLSYLYKTTTPSTLEEYSNLHRRAAELILNVCLKNEGLYIKLGQGFNAMNHVLPREYMDVLKVLLDNAPCIPFDEVNRIIMEETGKSVDELFSQFDPVPVASASIAQVHRAHLLPTTPGGEAVEVAVKVQKPYIRYQVFWDLETFRFVTWAVGALFGMPVSWARKTFIDGVRREIDFSVEAKNVERMRSELAENPHVYVPKLQGKLTTSRLLVLEWINGVKLIDVETVRRQFDDVKVLRTVFDVFGDMIFKYGFVHCDPHGANILVRPSPHSSKPSKETQSESSKKCKDPQVVLLDFGLCCPETERFRLEYALLFKSIVSQDLETLKKITTSWGISEPKLFASVQMQKPYDSFRSGNRGEVTKKEILEMGMKSRESAKKILLKQEFLPPELPLVGRSIDILRGINRLYGAPLNRVNMLVRRAVAGLGPINSYEGIQSYLEQLDSITAADSANNNTKQEGGTTDVRPTKRSETTAIVSVFAASVERRRQEQAAAAASFRMKRDASFPRRLRKQILSVYRNVVFNLVLFSLDLHYTVVFVYNMLLRVFLPESAAERLQQSSIEDIMERRQFVFDGDSSRLPRRE